MARKRLSDLLREEVQKPADTPSTPDETAPAAQSQSEASVAPSTHEAELAAALQREADLQTQVASLKADLKNQTAAAKKLQTNLEKAEKRAQQLATELAEVKQTALQLAESNSRLQAEVATLQRSQPTKSPVAAPPTPPTAKPELAAKPLTQQEVLRRRQADSLAHPMFPAGKAPGQFTEQDLGWVD
jgi:chromosome segregation ATPase